MFTSDPAPPDAPATHSHALWRTLLEATGDGVLVVGARGAVLATNPLGRLFALPPQAGALEGLPFGAVCERLGEAFADTALLPRPRRRAAGPGWAGGGRGLDDERRANPRVRRAPGARGGSPERAAVAVARRHRAEPAPR